MRHICTELERVATEYLANALVGGVEPLKIASDQVVTVTPESLPTLRIYRGEMNVDMQLPAIVVACDSAQPDEDADGNYRCQLEVAVTWQANPATSNPEPIANLQEAAETVLNFMCVENLGQQLNAYGGEHITAYDPIISRTPRKNNDGRNVVEMLTTELYCSNTNLNSPI